MSSEQEFPEQEFPEQESPELSALIDRLSNSSNLALLLPFLLAMSGQENGPNFSDRVIFLNPNTQSTVVVEGTNGSESDSGETGLESVLRDLFGGKSGQPPASKASMEAMPEVEVTESGKDCVICLEDFEVGGIAKEMPCKHRFHGACVEKWLRVHGTCPVCRYTMPVEERDGEKNGGGGGEEGAENGGGRRREIWVSITIRNIANASGSSPSMDESS